MKINTTPKKNNKKWIIAIISVLLLVGIGTTVFLIVHKGNSNNSTDTELATNTDVASNTDVVEDTTEIVEDTTETTETVEETTETVEEPSVETPSENTTTETEKPSTTETPSNTTTETPSQPTTSEPTTTETTSEPTPQPTPNVEKCVCGTPMQMMSGYILHRAEGYYARYVYFSNGEKVPYEDRGDNGEWIGIYMIENGIGSYTIVDHWVETTPEWREENVTRMCCPHCRATNEGFIAY